MRVVDLVKKRVLIVNNNMHIGGVQRALVNLLKCIHDRYEITLLLFHPEGELMKDIPEGVQVLPVCSAYRFLGMTKDDVRNQPANRLGRSFFAAVCRLLGRDAAVSLMAMGQRRLTGYDAAISYLHDAGDRMFYGGCNDFVLRHVEAKRKYSFLHCDFLLCGANTSSNLSRYARFDGIAACSEGCRKAFVKAAPDLEDKTFVSCNCQDYEAIGSAAEEANVSLPADRLNILTVARLGREKGVPRAIAAFAALKETKVPYHYYIIGDGREREETERLIRENGLEDSVTLLGEMANPYGYMKAADLLLIPSRSEAAPMVIGEAACLGTPILTTETTSARDMVEKTGFGWVCENHTEGIMRAVEALLNDPDKIRKKADALKRCAFDNRNAIEQFAVLLEKA